MTEQELREVFKDTVKKNRKKLNWSQVRLAQEVGVSTNFINDIETGKKWVSPTTMVSLADAFDMQVYELFKPDGVIPDELHGIIKEYTNIVHTAIEKARRAFAPLT